MASYDRRLGIVRWTACVVAGVAFSDALDLGYLIEHALELRPAAFVLIGFAAALAVGLVRGRAWAPAVTLGVIAGTHDLDWPPFLAWRVAVLASLAAVGCSLVRRSTPARVHVSWVALGAALPLVVDGLYYDVWALLDRPWFDARLGSEGLYPPIVYFVRAALEVGLLAAMAAFVRGRTWGALVCAGVAMTVWWLFDLAFTLPEGWWNCSGGAWHALGEYGDIELAMWLAIAVSPWAAPIVRAVMPERASGAKGLRARSAALPSIA